MPAERTPRSILLSFSSRACAALAAFSVLVVADGGRRTQDAIAQGETRTLAFVHNHTKETANVTFRRWGSYDSSALEQLNWLMRDWRRDQKTRMNPRLFDLLWEAQREAGSSGPIYINSAYRSPDTNAMLRRRSRAVSKHSQHMNGNALDFYLGDVAMARVREVAMRMQRGGVGYYPNANTGFVHLDVGSVRSWPRMSRDQLVRLFPDERTVHLPRDGGPLAGYEEARAMIVSRGGSVGGYGGDEEVESWSGGAGFFAALFGGGRGRGGGGGTPSPGGDDAGVRSFALNNGRPSETAVAQATPERRSLRGRRGAEPEVQVAAAPPQPAPAASPGLGAFALFSNPTPAQTARQEATPQVQVPVPAPVAAAPIQIPSAASEPPARARPVFAALPMPPRRPADLSRVAVASLDIPLPPARPSSQDFVATAAAEPPPSPAVDAIGAVMRRAAAAAEPVVPPAQAAAYAQTDMPLPPVRPGLRPTAVVTAAANATYTRNDSASVPTARTRTLATPVAPSVALAPVDAILSEFRRKADVGPSAGQFSGAAVKPMVISAKLR